MKDILIDLGRNWIRVKLDDNGKGSVECNLLETISYEDEIDGIKILILNHVCAGVNVQEEHYVSGIKSALSTMYCLHEYMD